MDIYFEDLKNHISTFCICMRTAQMVFNFFEDGVGQKFLCGFPNNTVCLKLVGVSKEAGRNFIIFYVHVNSQPKNVKTNCKFTKSTRLILEAFKKYPSHDPISLSSS